MILPGSLRFAKSSLCWCTEPRKSELESDSREQESCVKISKKTFRYHRVSNFQVFVFFVRWGWGFSRIESCLLFFFWWSRMNNRGCREAKCWHSLSFCCSQITVGEHTHTLIIRTGILHTSTVIRIDRPWVFQFPVKTSFLLHQVRAFSSTLVHFVGKAECPSMWAAVKMDRRWNQKITKLSYLVQNERIWVKGFV